jgi:glyoxylase-like metal-dependent hydrolase (beta-lactamase superfamily II)
MKEERLAKKAAKHAWFAVAPGVWGQKDIFVNFYMIHNPKENRWVLVDTGLKTSAGKIKSMAEGLFWPEIKPYAIVLTHAHFDHAGSVKALAEAWNVPVYAHPLEAPYLQGKSSYPPPDPTVGGGMMAYSSFLLPHSSYDIGDRFRALPKDHSVPGLPDWRWIHTPGHTAGHISLFRESDRVLLAGDAFSTTNMSSVLAVMRQTRELTGPPTFLTPDWEAAAESVRKLTKLKPEVASTGHGRPMEGKELRRALRDLADHFQELAVPSQGRYVRESAKADESGVTYLPKSNINYNRIGTVATVAASAALLFWWSRKPQKRSKIALLGLQAARSLRQSAGKSKGLIDQALDMVEERVQQSSKKLTM